MTTLVFTPDALRAAAELKAGYNDYGSNSYMAGLEALLYSIEHESQLHDAGEREMWRRITTALANRLVLVAWEKANPEQAAAPVKAPLVILGLGRTGSSILHETLAAAPGMRTPYTWQTRDFSLVHKVADPRADAQVQRMDADIASEYQVTPGYAAIHHSDAYVPMECVALTIIDMSSEMFSTVAYAPSYRKWLLTYDHREVYQWHRRALRFLQAKSPGLDWVLKTPMHSAYLGPLLETYPDAMIIQTHRDPLSVQGSSCSLYATLRAGWSDMPQTAALALHDAQYAADIIQAAVDYRRHHPQAEEHILDVAFKDFMADQLGTLKRIYDNFGLDFTDEAEDAMANYVKNRPREKYGKHSYTLEQFGMTKDSVAGLYPDYISTYGTFL